MKGLVFVVDIIWLIFNGKGGQFRELKQVGVFEVNKVGDMGVGGRVLELG